MMFQEYPIMKSQRAYIVPNRQSELSFLPYVPFKNAAKKRANSELKPHERTGSEKNKAIKRKWGTKVIEENVGATALVWNSARHFHLIENGHNLVRGGRIVGFVPGKHIMEKTRNEYENIVPQRFEEMIDEILKEGDLN